MKEIEAFQTSDGSLFTDEVKAESHQKDIIGTMLDDLIPNDDRGNITRSDRHNVLCKMMKDKDLKAKIRNLFSALSHGDTP